jgi:hypothetical protein
VILPGVGRHVDLQKTVAALVQHQPTVLFLDRFLNLYTAAYLKLYTALERHQPTVLFLDRSQHRGLVSSINVS